MKQLTYPKRKGGIGWIGWSVALTIIGVGSFLVYSRLINQTNTNGTPVSLIEVKTGTIEDIINESGIVKLEGQQTLKAPADATVAEVLVKPGDRFASGQRLVLLVDPERETSNYEQKLNFQKKQLELATKQRAVVDAKIDLEQKQKQLQTERELFERGFTSENDFQTNKNAVRTARSKLKTSHEAVITAKLDLELQELERRKKLAKQEKNLVIAPVSGKVLEVDVKRGDVVKLGDSLLTIGNPQQQIVELQVSTLNATKVKLGQIARVSQIGPNSQVYTGKVKTLSLIASRNNNSGSSNNSSQPTVSATVKLDSPTQKLIPGAQVSVDIVLVQQKDTVVLPTNAIVQNQGPPFVWVKSDPGVAEKKPVTLGLEGLTNVEILSGLKPGDRVILPSANVILKPGTQVRSSSE